MPLSSSLDHAGPLTWTVEDAAIVLQAIAGHDPRDPASADRPVPDHLAALASPDLKGVRLVIPAGFDDTGLPLSLQIVGRHFDEATVLRIGYAYERATPWRERRPPL